jgi:Putative Flp pilus-assembly TadE/G-like
MNSTWEFPASTPNGVAQPIEPIRVTTYPSAVGSRALSGESAHRYRGTGRTDGRRSRDERGSILVLFSVFITLFLMCCAIVVDVGWWWANGKKAQIAADACALAAARELPKDWGPPNGTVRADCEIAGSDWVMTNIPDQDNPSRGVDHLWTTVVSPYNSKSYQVEATVRLRVQTFFGTVFGLDFVEVERRAVAERSEGSGNYAIYSHDDDGCSGGEGLEFDGDGIRINGLVHSNGWYDVNSATPPKHFWAADGTINHAVCQPKLHPPVVGAQYGDGPDFEPRDVPWQEWPVWFTPGMFGWRNGCDYRGDKIEIKEDKVEISSPNQTVNFPAPFTIPTGTYCAKNEFILNGSGKFCNDPDPDKQLTGQITVLARNIKVDGSCIKLTPNEHNVLLFAVPNNDDNPTNDGALPGGNPTCLDPPEYEMQLNGEDHNWTGYLFDPCGRVSINVKDSSIGDEFLTGTIIAEKVKINSDGFAMIGKSDFGANILLALVE